MPLILLGARQIGKTYVLKEFGEKLFNKFHYFNFEENYDLQNIFQANISAIEIIEKLEINFRIKIDIKKDLVIFDEIQECPRAVTSLKYFSENLPQLHLIAAGSLLGVKLSSVSFPVGKVNLLTMSPMSFGEFLQANDSKLYQYFAKIDIENPSIDDFYHEKLWQEFKYYLIVGGMPKVVNEFVAHRSDLSKALALVEEVQAELLNTYYADIAKHSGKANAMHVQRILLNIPAQLAKAADGNSSRYHFKNVIEGKKQYSELIDSIDWLEAAGLIHKIKILDNINQPLMAHTKENFFKLYLFDLGILRALSKLDPSTILDYNFGTYKGYIAENFVLQQFVHASLAKESFYSWKENEAEIEFVRDIKGKIVPYEVKSGHRTQSKSLASFVKKYSPEKFYILSAQKPFIDKSGLHKMPIYLAGLL